MIIIIMITLITTNIHTYTHTHIHTYTHTHIHTFDNMLKPTASPQAELLPCRKLGKLTVRREGVEGSRRRSRRFAEFIAGQMAALLHPRNRGTPASKRDNDKETGGLLNHWIYLHVFFVLLLLSFFFSPPYELDRWADPRPRGGVLP